MAVTITQQPTSPNAAYTRLPFTLQGSVTTENPQYQYVMDVYESGSSERIARVTQTPNPEGVATFDPSTIIQGELSYDIYQEITGSIAPGNSVKTFIFKFGEQYGTSVSSSVTVYPDLTSSSLDMFPGVVDTVNISTTGWNFNSQPFEGGGNPYLTNAPAAQTPFVNSNNEYAYLVNSKDYMTVTAFQDNLGTEGYVLLYGAKVVNGIITGFPLVDALTFPSPDAKFTTLGVGPQNMADYLPDWKTAIDNGDINLILSVNDPGGFVIYINDLWDGIPVVDSGSSFGYLNGIKQPIKQCTDDYVRFSFINKYGFWDYCNVYSPVRRSSNIKRENTTIPEVDYSSTSSPYVVTNRGEIEYYTELTDVFEVTTDYIDKETSNWLEELLESPDVYVQRGQEFVPVNILEKSYTHNNEEARNKLFQYTIQFYPSNQPFGDWYFDLIDTPLPPTTYFSLEIDTDIDIISASLTLTDPFPGGVITDLITLNDLTGSSFSGSISESYSGSIDFRTVGPASEIFTLVTGTGVGQDKYLITNTVHVDGVLQTSTTVSGSYPYTASFDFAGGFTTANSVTSSLVLRNIDPPPAKEYWLSQEFSPEGKSCGVTVHSRLNASGNQRVYSAAPSMSAIVNKEYPIFYDPNLQQPVNPGSYGTSTIYDTFVDLPYIWSYTSDMWLNIGSSGSVVDAVPCSEPIFYELAKYNGDLFRTIQRTGSYAIAPDDRLYDNEDTIQSYYWTGNVANGYQKKWKPSSSAGVMYEAYDFENNVNLTFTPSGSNLAVMDLTVDSYDQTTATFSGNVTDEGNFRSEGRPYMWLFVYIVAGDFPNYNPRVNGSDHFYDTSPDLGNGGNIGPFGSTFTGLTPSTTYSMVAMSTLLDYGAPPYPAQVDSFSNVMKFTTPPI